MIHQRVVIFLHGLESGPDGLKIQKMRATAEAMGWQTVAPDGRFSRDPVKRSKAVLAQWPHQARCVYLVGSSLGGYVAASIAATLAQNSMIRTEVEQTLLEQTAVTKTGKLAQSVSHYPANLRGLLLLCPAFDLVGYPLHRPAQALPGAAIQLIHGNQDDVVPLSHSQRAAQDWGAALLTLEDDHSLHTSIVRICEVLAQRLACAVDGV